MRKNYALGLELIAVSLFSDTQARVVSVVAIDFDWRPEDHAHVQAL